MLYLITFSLAVGLLGVIVAIKFLVKNAIKRYNSQKIDYICTIKNKPMKQIKITTLEALLQLGPVDFSYKKIDGQIKTTRGTNRSLDIPTYSRPAASTGGGLSHSGNLSYYDLIDDQWKTVWGGAEISVPAKIHNPATTVTAPVTAPVTTPVATNTTSASVAGLFNALPDQLEDLLKKKIIKFEYITTDGDPRLAYGTNDAARVSKVGGLAGKVLSYFDIEKGDIRSLSLNKNSTVKVLEIIDIPLK